MSAPENPEMDVSRKVTLRDYFAGQALSGLLASGDAAFDLADSDDRAAYAAYRAYTAADAMLSFRGQGK